MEIKSFVNLLVFLAGWPYLFALVVLWPIVTLTIGRKFDKLFKKTYFFPYDPRIPILSHGLRSMNYAFCIIFKHRSTKNRYDYWSFHGYDFQANTNLFEKILSWVFVWLSLAALCIGAIALVLQHLLGYNS